MIGIGELATLLIFLLVVGAVLVIVVRAAANNGRTTTQPRNARQILDQRYAGGELDREEYKQIRRDIETG